MSKDNSGDKVNKELANNGRQAAGVEGFENRGFQTRPQPSTGREIPPVQTAPRTIIPMPGPKLPPTKK
ncbi:TPA: hypothetical protein ACPZQD_004454 [Yersinia enterocolitica]|uniref:hypothetical protein n=1 Tax=Enterobacterales TaxID=91347 RepID=UPI0029828872|nr:MULTISPECIES: hypothetical protein [Enterobacterales]EKN5086637.1 hypothetical protein [Yersinia enterocolitica]MDW5503137.1 hypothetical protein [Serratia proteamaculans]MDW5508194.1 hypothetical protein [Pseudomonas lundensis]WOI79638.1 hypothetical protein R0Q77_02005 [Citrobacter braakii]